MSTRFLKMTFGAPQEVLAFTLPLTYGGPGSPTPTSKLIKVVEAQFPRVEARCEKGNLSVQNKDAPAASKHI